jgi:hypothetical protein
MGTHVGCFTDPLGAWRIPSHLLLLSRRVLQSLLGRSPVVYCRGSEKTISWRALVPSDPAEHPPLLPLPFANLLSPAGPRRVEGTLVHQSGNRTRERGRFLLFRAKAVVLATGGIGRAYKITSNSWEYTGDGHSLAYHAGASLMDMEFVQFHPLA